MKGVTVSPLRTRSALRAACAAALLVMLSPTLAMAGYIPPDRGLPGRREGGGTRGDCLTSTQSVRSLIALMPESNFAVTVSERPTLYWYVPQTSATRVEFRLLQADETELYTYTFALNGQSGVIGIPIPAEVPALEVGKNYRWDFALVCDPDDASGNILTEGWVQRIQPSAALTQQLAAVAVGDRDRVYQNAGIWQDALTTLADQRRRQPTNTALTSRWNALLGTVGLSRLAGTPLASCCEPTRPNASR